MEFINEIHEMMTLHKMGVKVKCRRIHYGVRVVKRKPEIIISLTSHPARINSIYKTLGSLLNQTFKPDRLILWLAKEQFPKGESELPESVTVLKRNGLDRMWYHDIKSYKKLIPAMKMFPNAVIVTVDDDWYYRQDMLQVLVQEHEKYPRDIICHAVTHPVFNNEGKLRKNPDDKNCKGSSSFYNKMLGGSGVLYPPNSLHIDVLNEDEFMTIAPTNDDIWFWAMAVRNKTKIRLPENALGLIAMTDAESQNTSALGFTNEHEHLYEKVTDELLQRYPEIVLSLKSQQE